MAAIDGFAFWSSDYAYEIMGAKEISRYANGFTQETGENSGEEQFAGFRPRVDEYIPSYPRPVEVFPQEEQTLLGETDPNSVAQISELIAAQMGASQTNAARTSGAQEDDEQDDERENDNPEQERQQGDEGELSEEEREMLEELKDRDQEVRAHEQAHIAAGGAYITSGASYTYQTGPDGQQYAIGGEVGIDTSPVRGDPEATVMKMQTVIAAALAPAQPSGTDRAVAAQAAQTQSAARMEIARENAQETESANGGEETEQAQTQEDTQAQNVASDGNAQNASGSQNAQNAQNADSAQNAQTRQNAAQNSARGQDRIISAISAYTSGAGVAQLSATAINLVA